MNRTVLPVTPLLGERARSQDVSGTRIVARRPAAGNRAPQLPHPVPPSSGPVLSSANGIRPPTTILPAPAVLSPLIARIERLCYNRR